MKLGKIIGIGSLVGASLVNPLTKDANSESFYNEGPKEIIVNVERGDTLGKIIWKLDKQYGDDDPNDAIKNLDYYIRSGDIAYAPCGNRIKNPNIIEAGRDISFRGKALKGIDPSYGKTEIKENYVPEKNVSVINKSKTETPRKWGTSLRSDVSKIREYNKNSNRIGKFVFNAGVDYGIFEGLGKRFGEGMVFDVSAGYSLPRLDFTIGWSGTTVNTNEYIKWRESFLGFSDELEVDLEDKFLNQLYAQLMFGSKNFKIGGRVGVMSIGDTDIEASYKSGWGWSEGEYSRVKEYLEGKPKGYSVIGEMSMPLDDYLNIVINGKYGKYGIKNGPNFNIWSIGAKVGVKF